jgi:hypothetical protein
MALSFIEHFTCEAIQPRFNQFIDELCLEAGCKPIMTSYRSADEPNFCADRLRHIKGRNDCERRSKR